MDNTLLRQIVEELSARNGGLFAPRVNDSNNSLLRKWAFLINLGF